MAQVISGGQLLNLQRPYPYPSASYGSLRMYGEYNADYAAIYRTQPNVRRVVTFLAKNIAQLKIKAYERVSDDERRHLPDHPAAQLIRRPNPYQTRFRHAQAIVSDLAIYDDAYTVKVRQGGVVKMLLPVPPAWVQPDGKNAFWAGAYLVTINGRRWSIPREDVIHMHGYNPLDPRRGLSPMECLRQMLAEEDAVGKFREAFWRNNARHETVITRPLAAPDWKDHGRKRFVEEWRAAYEGAENAGKTPVLEEGMDIKTVSVSAKDAEYIASRKFSLEEAAGVYHVSPPLIGLLDEANFGSQAALNRQLLTNTLAPWTVNLQEEYELQLSDDVDGLAGAVYLEYNLNEKLRGSFEEEGKILQSATGGPWMTRNEARARRNLPPLPEGNELIVPLNVLVGGQASPQDSAPKRYLDVVDKHLQRQAKVLSTLHGANKSAAPDLLFDAQRWEQELTRDLLQLGSESSVDKRMAKAQDAAAAVNAQVYDALEAVLANGGTVTEAISQARSEIFMEAADA